MQNNSVILEEERLNTAAGGEKPLLHERHRAFPAVFEDRGHRRVIDVAAGIGYVAKNIRDKSNIQMIANDIAPTCLASLRKLDLPVTSYTIDNALGGFPFADGSFDAVIALATIEHVIHVDEFVREIHRILQREGCFYVSAPNYASMLYLFPMLVNGRTFHDPLKPASRYEFYAHVRYFTYQTLLEYIPQFGFVPEAVYLPVPDQSSNYQHLKQRSKLAAWGFRSGMSLMYRISPRWSSEPIICFRKDPQTSTAFRRVLI